MVWTSFGIKFKRSEFGETKLIETLIVFPNDTINTNPKSFALEISKNNFKNDLRSIMRNKLEKICEQYEFDFLGNPKINSKCREIDDKIRLDEDYGVVEFENNLIELNDLIKPFKYTPFRHTLITSIYLMIIAPFAFIIIARHKNKLEKQGNAGSVAYITYIFDGVLTLGGFAYFVSRSPSELTVFQWLAIIFSILIGIYLTLKYEKPNKIEQE